MTSPAGCAAVCALALLASTSHATAQAEIPWGIAAGGGLTSYTRPQLDMYFSRLRGIGAKWVRFDIAWRTVEPVRNSFNWTSTDEVVNAARRQGIEVLGILDLPPVWGCNEAAGANPECRPSPSLFSTFAAAAARHFNGRVSFYEIWNEENLGHNWSGKPDADQYIAVLDAAYAAIKGVNPGNVVLVGGLAPAADSATSVAPITFVKALYARVGQFDALALHPYSYPASPDYVAPWNAWQQMHTIHSIMASNNDRRPIWITEYGSPTCGPGTAFKVNQFTNWNVKIDYMSLAAQADLARAAIADYRTSREADRGSRLHIKNFFYYSLQDRDSDDHSTPENCFGAFQTNWMPKPVARILEGLR